MALDQLQAFLAPNGEAAQWLRLWWFILVGGDEKANNNGLWWLDMAGGYEMANNNGWFAMAKNESYDL